MSHKLLFHTKEIFEGKPVSINICPTGRCNLNCDFCYIKNRPKNDLELHKILYVIDNIPSLKSVQIGMGEPTIYPKINELIEALAERDLRIGIGTNGEWLAKIRTDNLYKISWMQIGITNYVDDENYISFNWLPCRFNFIYVFHKDTPDDLIDRLRKFREVNQKVAKFDVNLDNNVIVAGELHSRFNRFNWEHEGEEGIDINDSVPKFKPYKGICYYAHIHPMLLNDGYIYPCCVETDDFRHAIKNRICKWNELVKYRESYPLETFCQRCSKTKSLRMLNRAFNDEDREFVF